MTQGPNPRPIPLSPSRRRGAPWLLALALVFTSTAGCAGTIKLRTDQDRYAAGANLELTLKNQGLRPLDYNLCKSTLQRQTPDGWEEVALPPASPCVTGTEVLGVNRDGSWRTTLPKDLPAGEYRFLTEVVVGGGKKEVHSLAFSLS